MADGVVIDANIIPAFYSDYRVKNGLIYEVLIWITANLGIAINEHIASEWKQVCSADLFLTWYTDELKVGNIRKIECGNLSGGIIKKMRIKYGFPVYSADIHYIRCAYYTDAIKYIMTYDYDFYEPRCRKSSIRDKRRARECRQGRFCKFLLRYLGIHVGMPSHCKKDFDILLMAK